MALQIRGNSQIQSGTIENEQISSSASISLSKLSLSDNEEFSGNLTLSGANTHSGILSVTNSTDSTSHADGSLIVSGGVGIAKKLFVNSDADISGSLVVDGDVTLGSDDNDTITIKGNLQVDGTTTTVNSTTLDVDDLNITVAKGAANSAAADGAGLTIDTGEGASNPQLTWDGTNSEFNFNKDIQFDGAVTVNNNLTMTQNRTLAMTNGSNVNTITMLGSNGSITAASFGDGTATMSNGTLTGLSSVTSSTFQNHATTATFSVSGAGAIIGSSLDVSGEVEFGTLSDGTIDGITFVDEDDMSSDSASKIPTQQSVKAYVDSQVASGGLDNLEAKDMKMVDSTGSFIKVKEVIQYIDLDGDDATNNYVDLSVAADSEFDELSMVFLNGQKLRFGDASTNDYYIGNDGSSVFKRLHINGDTIEDGDVLEVRYLIKS